jgi:outer membrane protein OmpA-like peptidoglycan-associated protein
MNMRLLLLRLLQRSSPRLMQRSSPRKALCAIALLLASTGPLPAQDASEIDTLLETQEISFAQAAGFVLAAAGLAGEDAGAGFARTETALEAAAALKALPKRATPAKSGTPEEKIKLGELCALLMKAFNMKGGVFYTLSPGPRYSYRELGYLQVLPEPSDPARKVSGLELMEIVEHMLRHVGGDEKAAQRIEAGRLAAVAAMEQAEQQRQERIKRELEEQQVLERELERERMMESIQAQLAQQAVADTTVRVVDEGVTISLSDIQFGADSTVLLESERSKIREIATILSEYPLRRILVGGHTALAGTAEGRQRISTERAQAVADYLVQLGCRRADEITVQGYGAERPVADNSTAAGQALNRRVEITILDR